LVGASLGLWLGASGAGGLLRSPLGPASGCLTAADQAFVGSAAAFCLRALGRLTEAVSPMQTGLEMRISLEDWTNAAIRASNLSELTLTLGEVGRAVAFGSRASLWPTAAATPSCG